MLHRPSHKLVSLLWAMACFAPAWAKTSEPRRLKLVQKPELGQVTIDIQDGKLKVLNQAAPKITPPPAPERPAPQDILALSRASLPSEKLTKRETLMMDDSAPKNMNASSKGPHQDLKSKSVGGGRPADIQMLHNFWPMCVFIDSSVSAGNAIVKGMVDEAAQKCGVKLMVQPFFVDSNYPQQAEALKEVVRQKCNAVDGFKELGANRANAVVLTNNTSLPLEMCGAQSASAKDKFGCSELSYKPGAGQEYIMRNNGSYGGVAPEGQTAVAVVAGDGLTADRVAGVALGQGQMNLPPGAEGGNGVGGWFEGFAGPRFAKTPGWSPEGCEQMRQNSFYSEKGLPWNKNQDTYVYKDDRSRLLDITDGKQLFATKDLRAGKASGAASSGGSDLVARAAQAPAPGQTGSGGHPLKPQGAGGAAGGSGGGRSPASSGGGIVVGVGSLVGQLAAAGTAGNSKKLGYDDTVAKVPEGSKLDNGFFGSPGESNSAAAGGASVAGSTEEKASEKSTEGYAGIGRKPSARKREVATSEMDPNFFNEKEEGGPRRPKRGDSLRRGKGRESGSIYQ